MHYLPIARGLDIWTPTLWISLASGIVALCALAFTIFSSWWLYFRHGKLKAYEPHSFACYPGGSTALILRFPIVLFNSGAKPIVVQDLCLKFPDEPDSIFPFPWTASFTTLAPTPGQIRSLPGVFAVRGFEASQHFIEFGAPFLGLKLQPIDYRIQIAAKLADKNEMKILLDFTLRGDRITSDDQYLAYSNAPNELTDEENKKADLVVKGLREQLKFREQYRKQTEKPDSLNEL